MVPMLTVAAVWGDTVYTWRDAEGEIHLSHRLPTTPYRLLDVNASPSDASGAPASLRADRPSAAADPVRDRIAVETNAAERTVVTAKAIFEKARQAYDAFMERARRNRNFKRRKRSVIESLKAQAEIAYDEYRRAVDRANTLYRRAAAQQAADAPAKAR